MKTNTHPLVPACIALLASAGVAQAALIMDLSGDWNLNATARPTPAYPTLTQTSDTYSYNNGFSTAFLTNGQSAGTGTYTGPTLFAALRQYNVDGISAAPTWRAATTDFLEMRAGASTVTSAAGELSFAYVVKKANFINGMHTGLVGFDATSKFDVNVNPWSGVSKSLRAVVQNGSTWYISQTENTVATTGAKSILSDAASALWAVWDPTNMSSGSLNFGTTVAGSTFTDIQAVGVWGAVQDGATNPDVGLLSIQISAVAIPEPSTLALLAISLSAVVFARRRR